MKNVQLILPVYAEDAWKGGGTFALIALYEELW
jgi:hypothetical protein